MMLVLKLTESESVELSEDGVVVGYVTTERLPGGIVKVGLELPRKVIVRKVRRMEADDARRRVAERVAATPSTRVGSTRGAPGCGAVTGIDGAPIGVTVAGG